MTTKSDKERILELLGNMEAEILHIVGEEFAPKEDAGSPERKRLLGLLGETYKVKAVAGAQLQAMLTEARIDGIQTGIKRSTGGYGWTKPIRSVRTSNTAFKAYAVKFFNSKMKERREALLLQLKNERVSNQR